MKLEALDAIDPQQEVTISCTAPDCGARVQPRTQITIAAGKVSELSASGWWLTTGHQICCPKCKPEAM